MVTMNDASPQRTSLRYWLIVLVLVAIGFLTIFSFGLSFWFIAVGLIVLSPFRSRQRVFRSGFALFVGFLIGYVLVAPWGCGQSVAADPSTGQETVSAVVCTSPIGIEYSGPEPFDPSRTSALIAGGVSALIASAVTWIPSPSRSDRGSRTTARSG